MPSTDSSFRRHGASPTRRFNQAMIYILLVVVGFMVSYPIVMLILGSFAPPRGVTGQWFSLDGYREAFSNTAAQRAIWTSLWLAIVQSLLATSLAVFMSWAITRTNTPGRRFFHTMLVINFFLPTLPQLLAWTFMLAPRSGYINLFLRDYMGFAGSTGPFDIYSYGGIIFVNVLSWTGFLYLIISPAFRQMDSSLEESAKMSGASDFTLLWRITLMILMPAILGALTLAFIRKVESFETELLLGAPAGIYVFSTQIYYYLAQETTPNYPAAIALAMVLLVFAGTVVLGQKYLLGNRSYVTVTGKSFRSTVADIGSWRYLVLAVLILFFLLDTVLPTTILLVGSFQESSVVFRADRWTLKHWGVLLDPNLIGALVNTIVVALSAATIGVGLVTLISYIVHRTNFHGRAILDFATWVPYLLPGFVLSLGFLWAVLKGIPLPVTLYGTIGLFIIVFVIRMLPTGSRLIGGNMIQLSKELEEAAFMSGASSLQTVIRVVLPILAPSLIIAWLIFMIMIMRDFSTVLLLYGPNSQMLSIAFYSYWQGGDLGGAACIGLLMTFIGAILVTAIGLMRRYTNIAGDRSFAH